MKGSSVAVLCHLCNTHELDDKGMCSHCDTLCLHPLGRDGELICPECLTGKLQVGIGPRSGN